MAGAEQVLIEGWCQQNPSHSVGDLEFGAGGALFVAGAKARASRRPTTGSSPDNPCGDLRRDSGAPQTPPGAEGGALRSAEPRAPCGRARGCWMGRSYASTRAPGDGLAGNPFAASTDANARRVVAYGLRNPFRFARRPGTSELWIGDVGWNNTEEINRRVQPTSTRVRNFGWPCYEGERPPAVYRAAGLDICEGLYGQSGAVAPPFFSYRHSAKVVPGESCPTGNFVDHRPGLLHRRPLSAAVRRRRCSSPTIRATASGRCSQHGLGARPEQDQDVRRTAR